MWASKNRGVHTAYDDGEVECTGSGGGEGTTGAIGASVVVEGHGESNGILGDGRRERDGNIGVSRLDINAAFADTKAGRTIGPTSVEVGTASTFEEARMEPRDPSSSGTSWARP